MHDVQTMARYAKHAGLAATILTIGITGRFGWLQGEDLITSIAYAGGLAMASFFVGYGLVFAWTSHRRGLPKVITGAAVAVFAISVGVELMSHLGATASARNHDMAKAADTSTKTADVRAELERSRADLAAIKPARAPAAISADMASLETRPWFAGTAACTSPGSYGNSCRRYNGLKAELATSQQRARLDSRVAELTLQASTVQVGHSVSASQTGALAQYATWSIKPSEDDRARTNMGIQLWLALYFVAIGLVNLIAHALEDHEKPTPPASAEIIQHPTARKKVAAEVDFGPSIFAKTA